MTRLAGANAAVWSDIFLGNADEIAAALDGFRASLDELEQSLQDGDREQIEATIATAAAARERLESFAYRTAPGRAEPDPHPHSRPARNARADHPDSRRRTDQPRGLRVAPRLAGVGGVLVILVAGSDNAARARELLRREGFAAA